MKKWPVFFCMLPYTFTMGQNLNWDGSSVGTKTSDYNTSIQMAQIGWGSHHGILFNSYRSPTLVSGFLNDVGNTKHSFDAGPYNSGAGAIMYIGNGGRLDFFLSDNSTGANTNVVWGAPRMTISRNNTVGIGTANPQSEFQVNDSYQKISLGKLSPQIGQTLGWASQYIGLNMARNSTAWLASGDGGHNGGAMIIGDTFGQFRVANIPSTSASDQLLTDDQINQNTRFIITSAGNVGIGTTSPASTLSIKGDYGINIEPYSGGPTNFYVTSNSADNIVGVNARTKYGSWEIPDTSKPSSFVDFSTYNVNNPYYGGIAFITRSSGASGIGTEKMVLLNNGNVGIGTTNPDAKLAIKGQVHAQEVKVDLNGAAAPDYVFEKDYKLTSLEEIKNYIDQNKHLPEVPSAKEMEKNGVQLGEMNMLLLKKIEELTLYVIEQNKKMQDLQNQIKK